MSKSKDFVEKEVFKLNPNKKGADGNYHKLEIPVALPKSFTAT